MERVFFALWPDDEVRSALYSIAQNWRETCGGRLTRRENLHATVSVIGNVEPRQFSLLKEMTAAMACEPFSLKIDRGGYFKHNRIAWAGPVDAGTILAGVVSRLRERLRAAGIAFDERPYVPHITLLRDAVRAPSPVIQPSIMWQLEGVALVRSRPGQRGVTYEAVAYSARRA